MKLKSGNCILVQIMSIIGAFMFSPLFAAAEKKSQTENFKDRIFLSDYSGALPAPLLSSRVIFIGENHTEYSNHVKQLEIIRHLHKNNKKIAIGMEMFTRQYQAIIDDYLHEKISEPEFLKMTNYFREWGYDYNYYREIVDFAKKNKLDIIGLNIRNEIVHKIGRHGLRQISREEFREIPDDMDFTLDEYKTLLGEVFNQHSNHENRLAENFYFAQVLRDEYMAQSVWRYSNNNPDVLVVVLAGNGHIENGYGIPVRLKRISGKSCKTILLDSAYVPGAADYFFYTQPQKMQGSPRLNLILSENQGIVKVTGFSAETEDAKNPINIEDVLVSINDVPMHSIADIRLFLYGQSAGKIVKIKINRDNNTMIIDYPLTGADDETMQDE